MLAEIPIGETTTYSELAERLGDKRLARMVGQAVGHNPLSIIVPCHRVVGRDGKLRPVTQAGWSANSSCSDSRSPAVAGRRLF